VNAFPSPGTTVCATSMALGWRASAWALDSRVPEATRGFLLNHLISEHLPGGEKEARLNANPVTV